MSGPVGGLDERPQRLPLPPAHHPLVEPPQRDRPLVGVAPLQADQRRVERERPRIVEVGVLLPRLLQVLAHELRRVAVVEVAGGIGQEILIAMNLFDYSRPATLTVATIVAVLLVDRLSAAGRRRLAA